MSDREHLLEAFARGALVRPSTQHMGFVDVVQAIMHACGVPVALNQHGRDLQAHLLNADHVVLLMADGMGIDLVDRMPRQSWIRRHRRRAIHASFPSTTTSAVTTIATAQHPATHGVIGWWVHLPAIDGPATVFANDRAVDGRQLDTLGIGVDQIVPPSVLPTLACSAALVIPEGIVDSAYTRYVAGDVPCLGYRHYDEAINHIVQRVTESSGRTFTYWYTPSPDTEAHDEGNNSARVFRALERLDQAAADLETALEETGKRWRLIGTADHGHLDLDPRLTVEEDDPVLRHVTAPPSGDMRIQFWRVTPGAEAAFEAVFRQRFGQHFYLLTARDVEDLALFGPGPWSAATRVRSGTHVSISKGNASLRYAGIRGVAGYQRMQSGHSGLTPAEMLVPLIIAGERSAPPFST